MLPPAPSVPDADPTGYRRALIRPTLARRLKWGLETAAYVSFEGVLGALPLPWVARLGRAGGAIAHALLGSRRRIVERNLRIAFAGERSAAELDAMSAEVFRRSGANLLSSLGTAAKQGRGLAQSVVVRDEKILLDALARGKGVVAVLAHMGNWEAMAQWLPHLLPTGVKVANIYRPLNNPQMNDRLLATRARHGLKLFSKDENPLAMAAFLRQGGVLSILSDQRAGKIGELTPFFGRITSATPLPAILARRTGAALIGVSLRTLELGRWEVGLHAASEAEPATGNVMELLERVTRVSPEDVFWLQERWKNDRTNPHRPAGKIARGVAAPIWKRRRALLWGDPAGRMPIPPPAIPDDVDYETWPRVAGESAEAFLRRVDAAAALPLDYVVGAGAPDAEQRVACRRLGLGWVKEGT